MTDRTYTHPDVFTLGVAEGWAEAETNPTRIDWPARQAAAAIPFEVVGGHPVNPCEKTAVRFGRNEMGYWGETLMADALVTATCAGTRYLLMVERDDGYGWAVPGGHVESGETGVQAAVRELAEETGLTVTPELCRAMPPRYVPDPRASDEAWAVTIPVHIDLGGGPTDGLPEVTGSDDARLADWICAESYEHLTANLAQVYEGDVFPAHTDMLRQFLGFDPVAVLGALGASVWSPDFDAYASGQLDASRVRCALCTHTPCDCPPFGTPGYMALIDARHGRDRGGAR